MSTLTMDDIREAMEKCKPAVEIPVLILIGRKEAAEAEKGDINVKADHANGNAWLNGIPCKVVDADSYCKAIYKQDLPDYLVDFRCQPLIAKEGER